MEDEKICDYCGCAMKMDPDEVGEWYCTECDDPEPCRNCHRSNCICDREYERYHDV